MVVSWTQTKLQQLWMHICTGAVETNMHESSKLLGFAYMILEHVVSSLKRRCLYCSTNRAKVSDKEHGEYGWIHMRQSIHNPNIAVNMQSMVPGGCLSMTKVLRDRYVCDVSLFGFLQII